MVDSRSDGAAVPIEDRILRSLRKVSRAIDLHSRRLVAKHRLTGPQLVCLRALRGPTQLSASELAREVALSNATVTGILSRLEARGLIVREKSAADRRKVMISLSDEGVLLTEQAPSPLQEVFVKRLHELPEANRTIIDIVLRQIVEMMDAEEIPASPVLATGPLLAEPGAVEGLLGDEEPLEGEKG